MKGVLIALVAVVLLAAAGIGGGLWYIDHSAMTPIRPGSKDKVIVKLPKGASLHRVGSILKKEGLIADVRIWKAYLKLNPGGEAKAGRHELSFGMNMPELLKAVGEKPLSEDVNITMVEGWRLRDADEWLAKKGLIEAGAYLKAASDPSRFKIPYKIEGKNLEGYLLPETYAVPKGKVDVDKLIQRQIDGFHNRFVKPHKKDIEASGRSLHELVVMASMLEREEPKVERRPSVADVLYKRLDKKTPLGVDATSHYTLDEWNNRKMLLRQLRDINDPYNTRLKVGLPPTAIGAPSIESLLAAAKPIKNPYWYYLHDKNGNIHYGRNAQEHEANRRKYNVY